jgi:hypothetical protein
MRLDEAFDELKRIVSDYDRNHEGDQALNVVTCYIKKLQLHILKNNLNIDVLKRAHGAGDSGGQISFDDFVDDEIDKLIEN